MQPLSISPEAERGYYVIWNTKEWVRERVSVNQPRIFLCIIFTDLTAARTRSAIL